jgi:TonB-dependent receptor
MKCMPFNKRILVIVPFLFSCLFDLNAQGSSTSGKQHEVLYEPGNGGNGRISGTISDAKTGETLPGATALIEGTQLAAAADMDGKFSINNVPAGEVNIVINYISYASKKITGVKVSAKDVTNVHVLLDPAGSQDLQEVEVVAVINKENNAALVLQQKNNTSLSDGVSAEVIRKTPDRNTSDVLKRVSGVTIQEDKFVIVRGLNERYNVSFLNGAPLPSTEPDKKAFAFDLFPANMLDNIVVNKTATPDMPADFAGGIVQVNTKSIPDKNFLLLSVGTGFNSITTNRAKLVYNGGKYDQWGFDDGSRNLPSAVPSFSQKPEWNDNDGKAKMASVMPNDWGYSFSRFSPNTNFQLAGGYSLKIRDRDFLGVVFSLSNSHNQNYYDMRRNEYDGIDAKNPVKSDVTMTTDFNQRTYQDLAATAGLLNLTFKINGNNTIGFKNLLSGSSDNRFILAEGTSNLQETENPQLTKMTSRAFSANRIYSSQLNGEHFESKSKVRFTWNASYSDIHRTVPNMRFLVYNKLSHVKETNDPDIPANKYDTMYTANISQAIGPNYPGFRIYSDLQEKSYSGRADVSRNIRISEAVKVDVKTGIYLQQRNRTFDLRSFGIQRGSKLNDSIASLSEDQIFASQNMSVSPDGRSNYRLLEYTKADDNYEASSKLVAAYGMAEFRYRDKLRLIGGLRQETYTQNLLVHYYYPLVFDSIYAQGTVTDLLPSLNGVYNFSEKFGIRAAYYKTLNRPEFREMAPVVYFDPELRFSVTGRPELQRCAIQNMDLRFEMYPGRGQLVTVTGFYKYFDKPIERSMYKSTSTITYDNANFGIVKGIEFEYRVNLGAILRKDSSRFLNNLTLFSNLALIQSEVDVTGVQDATGGTRPMQGQSPYIINSGITYNDPKYHFSVSSMVNRIGERLYIVGNADQPHRWENARTVLDMQVTKSFFKDKLELRFTVKDLLQQDGIIFFKGDDRTSNKFNPDVDFVNFRRGYGSTYAFAVSYKF